MDRAEPRRSAPERTIAFAQIQAPDRTELEFTVWRTLERFRL
jgi:hypothetical protein